MPRARLLPDTDFASGAMLRLIAIGLQRQGFAMAELQPDHRATVTIAEKRSAVDAIAARFGATALLRIGEGVRDAPDEPALVALSAARDPRDLLARWQRLESYVHSRHRIEVEAIDEHALVVRHRSLDKHDQPSLGEDLLVFGVLTALIESVLSIPLTVRHAATRQVMRQDGAWLPPPAADVQDGIEFTWSAPAERERAPLPSTARVKDAVRDLVIADPAREWTLPIVALELGLATRTLQRRLREESCNFAAVVLDVRATHASRLLAHSAESLSTIGFVSGYSDQSHFTRDFKRRTAMTPASYRCAFSVPLSQMTRSPLAGRVASMS